MATTDVASLAIKVESLQVSEADRRLDDLTNAGGRAEKATDGLTGSFKRLIGPLLATVSAAALLTKLVDTQRQFDVLNASLITATGSTENAAAAFEALQQFAATTPYDLAQVTDSFTKLVNLGLTPSERALTSYGNTAAAMGKDLNQLIEAVADAATGEFERLKEFGIKAKQNGDSVALTFRGVKTEIGNNAAEIEQYLMALGENEFAGAMALRMDSLDGALSNLGDSWDQMFLSVTQSGIGDVIEAAVRQATEAIDELTAMLASGQIGAYLESITGQFDNFGADISQSFDILNRFIKESFGGWEDDGSDAASFLYDAFKNLPSNVRALIQILVVDVAAGLDTIDARATAFKEGLKALVTSDTLSAVGGRLEARVRNIKAARLDSFSAILKERDAAVKASDDQVSAAKRLRAEYDALQEAKRGVTGDRLAGFKQGGDSPASAGADKAAAKAAATAEKRRRAEFDKLVESLRTEEEAIAASYAERKSIIEGGTGAGSSQRAGLMSRLDADHAEQLKKLSEQRGAELEGLRSSLRTEEEVIQESYDRRLDIIHKNTQDNFQLRGDMEARLDEARDKALAGLEEQRQREKDSLYMSLMSEEEGLLQSYERKRITILESEAVTELERQDLLRRLKQQFDEEQAAMEMKRIQSQLSGAQSLFAGLAGLAKSYAGEQSKSYRALFAVSKAFAVAQAGLAIKVSIAEAMKLGWPAGLAAAASAAAQGASILSQITGENFAGAYDQGGQIPAGKIGLVGEYGPELVRGPASVKGRELTAREMRNSGEQAAPAAPPVINVKNINVLDPSVVGDYLATDDGEQMIMNVVQRNQRSLGG